jgi:thiol:disulfide interchange protein
MVRFREFAGFVLMGTVIFIIYYLEPSYMVPALVMLLGIALGLWMIGNLYDANSSGRTKMVVRGTALVLTLSIGAFGFRLTKLDVADHSELPWQQFTEDRLQSSLAERKTVLVDFTAKWCLTCKVNEKFALNTAETRELVDSHGVVTLYADYTRESPEIKKWLDKFDSISVPLTVIFPGGRAAEPIVIRDTYSKAELLQNLRLAVKGSEVTL